MGYSLPFSINGDKMLVKFTKEFNTKHCSLFVDTTSILCVYYFTNDVCACSVSSDSLRPNNIARQTLLSMGFPRHKHWSGLPFHPPGYLCDSGIEPGSPVLQADYLPLSQRGSP